MTRQSTSSPNRDANMHSKYSLFCVILTFAVLGSPAAFADIKVGLAQVDITPPVGGLTTGYASAEPTTGVHDRVTGRIMVMESGQRCIALVVCDLCIYNSPWLHSQMEDIGVDRLLMMNTHTHAGPKLSQDDFPSTQDPWRETVDQRLLDGIKEAKSEMFTGFFCASSSEIQLGYNRLVHRGDYSVTYFDNPQRIPYGKVDPRVGILRVTDEDDRVRSVIVTYACHPVVLGPRNREISADYPGVMRTSVEKSVGEDCLCIFIQGAAGDINPLMLARDKTRERDFEIVEAMGESLAAEVKRGLSFIQDDPGKSDTLIEESSQTVFRNRWKPEEEVTLGATTLMINGEIAIATMPGEPFHHFQVDFRQRAGCPHAFLFGYCCNGPFKWPSYLPDLQSAARGGYGASDTTIAEVGAGERLVNQALAQLYRLQGRLKEEPQRHTFPPDDSPE